jgi:hypothetical protein
MCLITYFPQCSGKVPQSYNTHGQTSYITLHIIDHTLVKMTVGYGISRTATKIHIPYN